MRGPIRLTDYKRERVATLRINWCSVDDPDLIVGPMVDRRARVLAVAADVPEVDLRSPHSAPNLEVQKCVATAIEC